MGRVDRINQAIKETVGEIVHRELKDPRLEFVTITYAEVSRDLQHAKVFFSVLGNAAKLKSAQDGLDSARGFVRKLLGQRVKMRYTPEINFIFDQSVEYGIRIEETIERVKNELKSSF